MKSFGGQLVLRGVDLDVPDGSITVIIGRSGGGKSVFLKHLLELLRPDSGQVTINGTDITNLGSRAMDEVRRHYGVVFQGGALFDSLTCFDNVAFRLPEKPGLGPDEIAKRVEKRLEQVGLAAIGAKSPAKV